MFSMRDSKLTINPTLKASSDFTTILLLGFNALGIVLLFNLNHRIITEELANNLLLTWKLVLILAFSFLYDYLMDLYTFESPLSQLGILERSFIANLLVGVTIALTVFLLGPRPERPEFIDELSKEIPYYNLRHTVKPGITGWAQVMTGYGGSTEDVFEKLQYDFYYIKNYSLILDISIMIKFVKVILFGTGR